jgi:hypothetical protein
MRAKVWTSVVVLGLLVAAGCGSPPKADIDAAKAALEQATTAGAGQYAAESLKAAQDAQTALDAELKAQQGKWFGSYDKAKQLAVAAKAAGEKAVADAAAGKEKAKADASAAVNEAKTLLTEAQALLDKAPKGKGSAADIEAMKGDLTTAGTAITEAETALGAERFLDAKAKAESAKAAATTVKTAVEAAMAAKKK